MENHGRCIKVVFCLMAAMTSGALILLMVEGKPIRPMPFSLSSPSSSQQLPVHTALGLPSAIETGRWQQIEISYQTNEGWILSDSAVTGPAARDYHFIISDGNSGQDGQIYPTGCWTQQLPCRAYAQQPQARKTIRICLLCDSPQNGSTPRQARQLESLVLSLVKNCQIEPIIIWKNN